MKDYNIAKLICKNHGVKGFKKMKIKRPVYVAGRQTVRLNKFTAKNLIRRLIEEGFTIAEESTCIELADKGMLDCLSIS